MLRRNRKRLPKRSASRNHAIAQRALTYEGLERRLVLTSYIVNTLDDTIAIDGLVSLREALGAANSNAPFADAPAGQPGTTAVDQITFSPELTGREIKLGDLGTLTITDSVSIKNTDSNPFSLNGQSQHRIFEIAAETTNVSIERLVLQNGNALNSGMPIGGAILINAGAELNLLNSVISNNTSADGGGLYNDGGSLMIANSTFTGNVANAASSSGGAIFHAAGSLNIESSQFTFNQATRAGGAIETVDGTVEIRMSNFINNDVDGRAGTANPGNGGALHVSGNSMISVNGGIVLGNRASSEGGGFWNQMGSTLSVTGGTRFLRNVASGDAADNGGGAIFNNGGIVVLDGSSAPVEILNNFADGSSGSGGGIFNLGGKLLANDVLLAGNEANRAGGGIEATAGSTNTLTNVVFDGNNAGGLAPAPGNGGALHITGDGDAELIGGEVVNNIAASEGGGLWNGTGLLTVDGTLIANNVASGDNADNGGGGVFNNGGDVQLTDALITDNLADGLSGSGGGLLSVGGEVQIANSTLQFNAANRAGGAIEIILGTLRLGDTALVNNDVAGTAGAASPGNGGAVHITGAANTFLSGGTVFGNTAQAEGGGLWNSATGTMTIENGTLISANSAFGEDADQGGGGVFNDGGTLLLDGTDAIIEIIDNFADGSSGSGGGIFNLGGTLLANDVLLAGNEANRAGGGIEATAGSTNTLTSVVFDGNNAGGLAAAPGNGGALHITGDGDAELIGGEVVNNIAASEGGGLWNGTGLLTVDGTLIANNVASGDDSDNGGGGVFNNGGDVQLTDVLITDNLADGLSGSGGGLLSVGGEVQIANSTLQFNAANRAGGAIEIILGSLQLSDTALVNNDVAGTAGPASPGNGGAVHITGAANTFVSGGTIFGNSAQAEGGGLWNSATGTMTIENGTLINANSAFGEDADQGGGGVFNDGGTLVLDGTDAIIEITDNFADGSSGSGGGIFNLGGTLLANDVLLEGNEANRAGGGIEATAGSTNTLTNVVFDGNNAGGLAAAPGNGGALHITGDGDAELIGGEVVNNIAASEGGGLWNGTGLLTVDGTLIANNVASGDNADNGGGGVFNNGGDVQLTDVLITDNLADGLSGSGGGLLSVDGEVQIANSTLQFNAANRAGGAIEIILGTLRLGDTALVNNDVAGTAGVASPGNGGAVHISGTANTFVSGGTIFGNSAQAEGGGLWNSATGTMTITNGTLISANSAFGEDADQGGGGVFNDGGTLVLDGTNASIEIIDNFADGSSGSGGGILNLGGTLLANDVLLAGNEANRAGGGIEATAGSTNTLTNVIFDGNNAGGLAPAPGNGGALHITGDGDAEVIGGEVVNNLAASEGGGLWNGTGLLTVDGTLIANNVASGDNADNGGGGVFNNGGNVQLTDVLLLANSADGLSGSGGGVLNLGGSLTVDETLIGFNTASRAGGGIEDVGGTAVLNSVTLSGNRAASAPGNGGGLHITGASSVAISNAIVTSNFAANEGGGLWNSAAGVLSVVDTTINDNVGLLGAGIFNDGPGGAVEVTSSTISGNTATSAGGGILSEGGLVLVVTSTVSGNEAVSDGGGIQLQGGDIRLESSTIADNEAFSQGGGIAQLGGNITAINTLIANNSARVGPDGIGTLISEGFNLVSDSTDLNLLGDLTGNQIDIDPQIGVLQNNGGLTETHALLAGSPAIDAGTSAGLNVDQRETPRPQGDTFDIGAFEAVTSGGSGFAQLTAADANQDGVISAIDVLQVINFLSANDESLGPEASKVDVNGDGLVSPVDALLIVNLLNSNEGELLVVPELETVATDTDVSRSLQHQLALLDFMEERRQNNGSTNSIEIDLDREMLDQLARYQASRLRPQIEQQ